MQTGKTPLGSQRTTLGNARRVAASAARTTAKPASAARTTAKPATAARTTAKPAAPPRFAQVLAAQTQRAQRSAGPASIPSLPPELGRLVDEAARRYGVDPALIAGVIDAESSWRIDAVSPAGAKGLMQLMDETARLLGVSDSLDPAQNVMGGAKFLRQLLDRYNGDTKLALAAYNAGPVAVDRYGGIPPYAETKRYVPKVLAAAERFRHQATTLSLTGA
ncbi:MAG: transglycosylase SLT domain-containing protein [Chloroflexi bacterium]|nr:transglycosylase SLT domain-containing protein [Chloroflexota bacterium]